MKSGLLSCTPHRQAHLKMLTTQAVMAVFLCLSVGCSALQEVALDGHGLGVPSHKQRRQKTNGTSWIVDERAQVRAHKTLVRSITRDSNSQEQGFHDAQEADD